MKNISSKQLARTILVLASALILIGQIQANQGVVPAVLAQQATPTPTPTATPTPTSSSAAATNFKGEYFNNIDLVGFPVFTRTDGVIKFDWGGQAPDPGMPVDNFSVRWTKTEDFKEGTYRFVTKIDDGVRLYVDNEILLDKWFLQNPSTYTVDYFVKAGSHTVKMEYCEATGIAIAELSYGFISASAPTANPISISTSSSSCTPKSKGGTGVTSTTTPSPTPTASPVAQGGTGELPKTGLPLLAWTAAAFIPIGLKLRQFSKSRGSLEDTPHYRWEEKQHKSIDNK